MEIAELINHLQTIEREIPIEGNEQRARIALVHLPYIPVLIANMKRLDQYEKEALKNGKEHARQPDANRTSPIPIT
jgi:hypothetical protein